LGKKNKAIFITSMVVMALVIGGAWMVAADAEVEDSGVDGECHPFRGMWMLRGRRFNAWSELSQEQRSELRSEIQELITNKFEEWGLEAPTPLLTEEQRSELMSEIQELRDAGATREEIRELVSSKFEEWGIELPEPLLSDEQRSELKAGIEQLREDGATPEEIREFIDGKLEEWGFEPRQYCLHPSGFMRRGRFMRRGFMPIPPEEN